MATQEDVRRIALSLPDTSEDPGGFRFLVAASGIASGALRDIRAVGPRWRSGRSR